MLDPKAEISDRTKRLENIIMGNKREARRKTHRSPKQWGDTLQKGGQ